VAESNAEAARLAAALIPGYAPPERRGSDSPVEMVQHRAGNRSSQSTVRLLAGPRAIVNVGLELFVEALAPLVPVVQVQWQPPAGGDLDLLRILNAMEDGGKARSQ
jgi:hypothetical protein